MVKKNIDCKKDTNNYLNSELIKKNIPTYHLGKKINTFTESNIESIIEIYNNIPSCQQILNNQLIDKIMLLDKYIIQQGGHAFGCNKNLYLYRENEFKKKNLETPIPRNKSDFLKYNFRDLNDILEIYQNTPTCYALINGHTGNFDDKLGSYLKKKKSSNIDTLTNVKDLFNLEYHPYYKTKSGLSDLDSNCYFEQKCKKIKEDSFNFEDIIEQTKIDDYYENDLFKDSKNKILNTKKLTEKINNLESRLKNCCLKNSNNSDGNGILQKNHKGYTSAFTPEIIIDT